MAVTKHDGRDVRQHQIKVTNTGDGLSQAVTVDPPVDLHIGTKVYALIECEKFRDSFDPINGGVDLKMIHTLRGGSATLIDAAIAKPMIEKQTDRIIAAREEEAKQSNLGDPNNGLGATKAALDKTAKKATGAKASTGAKSATVTQMGAKKAAAKKAPAKKS